MQSSVGPEAAARSRCPADINALTLCWIEGLLGQEPYAGSTDFDVRLPMLTVT